MEGLIRLFEQHHLWLLLGVGAAFTAVWLALLRKRLGLRWYAVLLLAAVHTLYGVFTVKAFAFLESGFSRKQLGAMSLFGGVFFMPPGYWLGAKLFHRPVGEVFDLFTPCMIFTVMCARINCIVSGCCLGAFIPGLNGARFPTREAEILFYLVVLAVLCPRVWRGKTGGRAYPIYMMSYGAVRFILEFFRSSPARTVFHLAHLWALVSLLLGASIYVELSKRAGKQLSGRKRRG